MNYERFTVKNWREDKHTRAYDCLAELEDKIENGTLIELPCEVGDTIFVPWEYNGTMGISFHRISEISCMDGIGWHLKFTVDTDDEYVFAAIYSKGIFSFSQLGNRFFLSREEAEKHLKGRQGENKNV